MATIKYKGMELEEITEPQIFDPPKTMVVDDGRNGPRTARVTAILPISSGHDFRVLTDNSVICYSRCALLPKKTEPRRATNRGLGSMGGEVTLAKLAPENGGIAPRYFGNLSEDVMAITERYRNDDLCVHEGRAFIFDSDSKNWKELDMAPVCGKKCDTRESKCRWAVYIRSLEETKARLVRSHDFVVDHKEKAAPRRSTNRELAKWLSHGKGEWRYGDSDRVHTNIGFGYECNKQHEIVDEKVKIRKWDDTEWHDPTVDYMGIEEKEQNA